MPRSKNVENDGISEKLKFLGLDLDKIPESLKKYRSLEYRPPRFYDEKQYKQYRYVNVNDIDILLTPSNRLDDLNEKYKKASPLFEYLDSENEENIMKYTTFLSMLKNISIEDIEKVEAEQEKLSETIPFKVKFEGNYLWQIYYSENTDRYFMLVPTQDTDYSAFFYLLKKKIEGKKDSVIYVPISGVRYSNQYLKKAKESYKDAKKLLPKDYDTHYNSALTNQLLGNVKEAGLEYCKAIQLKPYNFEAHYNYALLLRSLKFYKEAMSELEKAGMLADNEADSAQLKYIYEVLGDVRQRLVNAGEIEFLNSRVDESGMDSSELAYRDGKVILKEDSDKLLTKRLKFCPKKEYFEGL